MECEDFLKLIKIPGRAFNCYNNLNFYSKFWQHLLGSLTPSVDANLMPLDALLLAKILALDVAFTMQNVRPRALMTAPSVRKKISWKILKN